MTGGFEDAQRTMRESLDTTMKAVGAMSKGWQALASETADYSRRSFEEGTAMLEKLAGARSFEAAVEIQSAYMRSVYDGMVGGMTRFTEMSMDLAREAYKPFETAVAGATR